MTLVPAPFHVDLSEGPDNSRAYWIKTDDGLRLRVAHYPSTEARGTVLLFPGRTEYVEKYGRTAADLSARGYHVLAIDWRGQGLADRMLEEPMAGHVHVFEDYQRDVAAMLSSVDALDLPRPLHLLAHSMGGCIGLRAVMDGLPVDSCVFSGPMWGIRMSDAARPAAWALTWWGKQIGLGHKFAPGTKPESYVLVAPFKDNLLTRDPDMWSYMQRQVLAVPELQLGGPSLNWLLEALGEMRQLARRPSPAVPCLTLLGTNERIVDKGRIEDRMKIWPGGRLVYVPDGEHEVLIEDRDTRTELAAQIASFFDTSSGKAALTG